MNTNSKYKIIGVTVLFMTVSALTWAFRHDYFEAKKPIKPLADSTSKAIKFDPVLLDRFETISKKYNDIAKKDYTLAGVINSVDKADTAVSQLKDVNFFMCKSGNEFYYKLGATETFNQNGLYLFVDNAAKKIILSNQLGLNYEQPGLKGITSLSENLRSEEYNIISNKAGSVQTITLVNERHITCKEYAMSFDTVDMQLKHLYIRLTNFQEPERKDKEKVMDVAISEFDNRADLKKYRTTADVVRKEGGQWKATNDFADYELILR